VREAGERRSQIRLANRPINYPSRGAKNSRARNFISGCGGLGWVGGRGAGVARAVDGLLNDWIFGRVQDSGGLTALIELE
jgi:hypothetical protein